jgi:hypothetical protein
MNIANQIILRSLNANDAMNQADKIMYEIDQDWENGATLYTFEDKSVLVVIGSQVNDYASMDEARSYLTECVCRATYPAGLTGESAYYACDGPDIQRIEELQRIIRLCNRWETAEAQALADEARSYLVEYE